MNEINKLVDLVAHGLKNSFNVIDLFGDTNSTGKEQRLFNGVLWKKYQTDEHAAKGMYGADIYDQRFRMLKSRLRYKLYDLLYYYDFDLPQYSYTLKIDLECKGYLHKAQILRAMGEDAMADKQLNKAIVFGEENQMTSSLLVAYELKSEILSLNCKPTDFEIVIKKTAHLRTLRGIEAQADDLFYRIRMLINKSMYSRNTCQNHLVKALRQLKQDFEQTQSYNIYQHYYQIKVWFLLLENDHTGLVAYTKEAIQVIEKLDVNLERFDLGHNSLVATRAHLSNANFEDGYEEAKNGLQHINKSNQEWFFLSENYFLLAMHNKDYSLAKTVLKTVLKNPNYGRAAEEIVARWKIFRVYLNFTTISSGDTLKRVRFNELRQASKHFYREAKGYYMTLSILEFLHKVNQQKLDEADMKLDDVENYYFKNLNEPGKNPREKQFYKMLKVMRTQKYDVATIEEKAEKYLEKLTRKKTLTSFADFEIIPYEHLWEIILYIIGKIPSFED